MYQWQQAQEGEGRKSERNKLHVQSPLRPSSAVVRSRRRRCRVHIHHPGLGAVLTLRLKSTEPRFFLLLRRTSSSSDPRQRSRLSRISRRANRSSAAFGNRRCLLALVCDCCDCLSSA